PLLSGMVKDPRTPRWLAERLLTWVRPAAPPASQSRELEDRPANRSPKTRRMPRVARMDRALRLRSHGPPGQAQEELLALRDKRREDPAVWSALGLCLLRLAKPKEALAQFEQAAALAPQVAAHTWNAAVAAHLIDQPGRCYASLKQYLGCHDE